MHTILTQKVSTTVSHLTKYGAGLLLCLQWYVHTPVFSDTTDDTQILHILRQDPDTMLYSAFVPQKDREILGLPIDQSIEQLNILIEQTSNTPMEQSLLQSRRYYWLGNRYVSQSHYASATKAYLQSQKIFSDIKMNIDQVTRYEHDYRILVALAKTYNSQEVQSDPFIYDKGINAAQDAAYVADTIISLTNESKYIDRKVDARFWEAALHTNAKQYNTANLLYDKIEDFYKNNNNLFGLFRVAQNRAYIADKQNDPDLVLSLMKDAQDYFDKSKREKDANYKIFLLNYTEYQLKYGSLEIAKAYFTEQKQVLSQNQDILLLEEKIGLLFEQMQNPWFVKSIQILKDTQTPRKDIENIEGMYRTGVIHTSEKIEILDEEQDKINAVKHVHDIEIRYETEKKQAAIEKQLLEIKAKNAEIRTKQAETTAAQERADREEADKKAAQAQARESKAREERERAERKQAQTQTQLAQEQKKNIQLLLSASLLVLLWAVGAWWILKRKNTRIQVQNQQLAEKNHVIDRQKEEVEGLLGQLKDAVRSWWSHQKHYLENAKTVLKKHLDHFIFHSPHEPDTQVSGDFYRAEHIDNKTYLVTADCTWHGVEWALGSIMMISSLNQIIMQEKSGAKTPAEIRDTLHKTVCQSNEKKTKEDGTRESAKRQGMDATLCIYDASMKSLEFVWSNHSVYILREKEKYNPEDLGGVYIKKPRTGSEIYYANDQYVLIECATSKQPIWDGDKSEPFANYKVNLHSWDTIYTFSDGYVDQSGGPENKKFMSRRMRELLLFLGWKSLEEQEKIIEREFLDRKWSEHQTDDILVIGVKVP